MSSIENIEALITKLVEEYISVPANENIFLVEVQYVPSKNTVNVFADTDEGISIEECMGLSRHIEHFLDDPEGTLPLGEKYTLEVSSPGVGKPLTLLRSYQKNIGRLVAVSCNPAGGNAKLQGILVDVIETGITLEFEERVAIEGTKKKENVVQTPFIPFEHIKQAVVKVMF